MECSINFVPESIKDLECSINFVPESIKDLVADSSAMGSTVCVRFGAILIPNSYCDVCHDVLRFICSSCFMNTVERIHTLCYKTRIQNNNDSIYLQDPQKLMEETKSYQLLVDNT